MVMKKFLWPALVVMLAILGWLVFFYFNPQLLLLSKTASSVQTNTGEKVTFSGNINSGDLDLIQIANFPKDTLLKFDWQDIDVSSYYGSNFGQPYLYSRTGCHNWETYSLNEWNLQISFQYPDCFRPIAVSKQRQVKLQTKNELWSNKRRSVYASTDCSSDDIACLTKEERTSDFSDISTAMDVGTAVIIGDYYSIDFMSVDEPIEMEDGSTKVSKLPLWKIEISTTHCCDDYRSGNTTKQSYFYNECAGGSCWDALFIPFLEFRKDTSEHSITGYTIRWTLSVDGDGNSMYLPLPPEFYELEIKDSMKRIGTPFPADEISITRQYIPFESQELIIKDLNTKLDQWIFTPKVQATIDIFKKIMDSIK